MRRFATSFLLVFAAPLPAQTLDLAIQVGIPPTSIERGEVFDIGFIVSNPGEAPVDRYRVELFASRDEFFDASDIPLGNKRSDRPIGANVFREDSLAADSCRLTAGTWWIIGELRDVEPSDENPQNDSATSANPLSLVGESGSCPESPGAAPINSGLNDAWFDPGIPGQGVLLSVFPSTERIFLAWFTFDTVRPAASESARLGEAGHRWLTAVGTWNDGRAELTVTNTMGGRFDRMEPEAVNDEGYGIIVLEVPDCERIDMRYDLPPAGVSGRMALRRATRDNVALCDALASDGIR